MAHELSNRVREERQRRGWSQDELAARAGLSRAGVSAIEVGRLIPSAAAALALAGAFGCAVEDLFRLVKGPGETTEDADPWVWPPTGAPPHRYWHAELHGKVRWFPVEPTPLGVLPHDGVTPGKEGTRSDINTPEPEQTLIMACCDPAVGLLAAELSRACGIRLIALSRSSREALRLLSAGHVHVAGVHLAGGQEGNDEVARTLLGAGTWLVRAATWEEGVALGGGLQVASITEALKQDLRWVGREPGSGARQCLDELLEGRRPPRRLARDHRGVAEAVRSGWADAGVCLRLAGEEAGLSFLPVRQEAYDLCIPGALRHDPRVEALLRILRSASYRRLLDALPGYDARDTGAVRKLT